VTFRFAPTEKWHAGPNGIKRGYDTLNAEYGAGLPFDLLQRPANWRRRTAGVRKRFIENIAQFQLGFLLGESAPVLRLFSSVTLQDPEHGLRPAAILAPYLPIANDDDLEDQAALWAVCPRSYDGVPVEGVLMVHRTAFDREGFADQIIAAVDALPLTVVWLWVPELDTRLPTPYLERRLRRYQDLVRRLSERRAVKLLHVTFAELLLSYDGVDEAACGAQLGLARAHAQDGGFSLGQFYSTVTHSALHFPQARAIVDQCRTQADLTRELCACSLCADAYSIGLAQYKASFLSGTPLLRGGAVVAGQERPSAEAESMMRIHNLVARRFEVDAVRRLDRAAMANDLLASAIALSDARDVVHWYGRFVQAG
jgi:hypothetical protein